MKIEITQQVKDESEMADLLKRIAELIEEGYTSGYHPHWTLIEEAGK